MLQSAPINYILGFIMHPKTHLAPTLFITLLSVSACTTTPTPPPTTPTPQTVSQIRLNDYLGTWYEIGRLPMNLQDKCTHNVTATYTLKDNGKIHILNTCQTANGQISAHGEAHIFDTTNARFRVSFLPGFLKKLTINQSDYLVIATTQNSQNYTSALVGTPDHKYLWILSRTPTLDDAIYQNYLAIARQNGYDLSKFAKTQQK